ncbi:MAG: hypothetical protein QOD77_350 [Thermoplasmata archaeon]|jgi:hypothetical protein|nr:hypothetical protein [Thermoplasmata archaeon]
MQAPPPKRFVAVRTRSPDACYTHPRLNIQVCHFDLDPFRVVAERRLSLTPTGAWGINADFLEDSVLVTYGQDLAWLNTRMRVGGMDLRPDQVVVDVQKFWHLDPSLLMAAKKAGIKTPKSEVDAARVIAELFAKKHDPRLQAHLAQHPGMRETDYEGAFRRDRRNLIRLQKGKYKGWSVPDAYLDGYDFQDLNQDARSLAAVLVEDPASYAVPAMTAHLQEVAKELDEWMEMATAWIQSPAALRKPLLYSALRGQLILIRHTLGEF